MCNGKKTILNKASEKFLEAYLNNASPTGFESSGQQLWLDYIRPYIDEHIVDTYGTVVGVVNPDAPYKVVIEAHADEISYFVHYITADGYIYLKRNGGSDHQIAPSKRVDIHRRRHRQRRLRVARNSHPYRGQRGGANDEEHLPRCGRQRQEGS